MMMLLNWIPKAFAQGSINLPDPFGGCDILCIADKVIRALFWLSVPVVTIMVLVGAFQIMFAAGNEEQLRTAKRTIWYAIIGFIVVSLSSALTSLIRSVFS